MSTDDILRDAVRRITDSEAREGGVLTLGELRAALKVLPEQTPVVIDCGGRPASLASYRGYYERLAIGTTRYRDGYETEVRRNAAHPIYDPNPDAHEVTIAAPVTVSEVIKALDLADGETFEGYKGGSFRMDAGTFMHFAEYGDCGRAVVGVHFDGAKAIVKTAEKEW